MRRRLGLVAALCLAAGLGLGLVPSHPAAEAAGAASASGVRAAEAPQLAPAAADSATRPNIVLITADDMRADDLEFMPRTKRLMARAGVSFTDALSNYPLCCPARATLLTGQYSHNNGVQGNEWPYGGYKKFYESGAELETLPVWLQRAGYSTGFIGKYLNYYGTDDPEQRSTSATYVPPGWDDWNASIGKIFRYYCVTLNQNGTLHRFRGQYQTDLYTRLSEDFIANYAKTDKPFFLWTSHLAPHFGVSPSSDDPCASGSGTPTPPAERHRGMFKGLPLPASPALNEEDMSDKGTYMKDKAKQDLAEMARVHQGRVESLQALDESVSDTIAALDAQGVLDDTMIIFASDNGWLLGEHRSDKKILPYEESLTVPLLARGPGLPSGVRRHQPVGLVDIPATAIEVSGALATKPQDGVSLVGLANDPTLLSRRVMPIEAGPAPGIQSKYNATQPAWFYRGARSSGYTYIAWQFDTSEEEELYDLDVDPFQLESQQATSPELKTLRRYSQQLETCAGSTGPTSCVTELPEGTEDGVPAARTGGDTAAPRIRDVKAPKGWIDTTRPTISYAVTDPTDPAGRLSHWCSHHALGCDGKATLQLPGEGLHDWTIHVTDPAGNIDSAWGRIKVDLYRPRLAVNGPRNLVVEGASATLPWRVTDSGSGVAAVDTRKRTAGLSGAFTDWAYPARLQGQPGAPRRTALPRANGTVCLEVRARDVAGRKIGWTGQVCRSRAIDAANLDAKPKWRTVTRDGWYAGTATVTSRKGATLTARSTGGVSLVRLVAQTGPGMGTLRVDVGGTLVKRVDLAKSWRSLDVFDIPVKGLGGRVSATVTTSGRQVWVDSLGVVKRPGR